MYMDLAESYYYWLPFYLDYTVTLSSQVIGYSRTTHSRDCTMHDFDIGIRKGTHGHISQEHTLNGKQIISKKLDLRFRKEAAFFCKRVGRPSWRRKKVRVIQARMKTFKYLNIINTCAMINSDELI